MMTKRVVIRCLTMSVTLTPSDLTNGNVLKEKITAVKEIMDQIKNELESGAYQVQTLRLAFNPCEEYLDFSRGESSLRPQIRIIDRCVESLNFEFVSLGPIKDPRNFKFASIILHGNKRLNLSAQLDGFDFDFEASHQCARSILQLARLDPNNNFRYAMAINVPSGTPFFPVGYFDPSSEVRFSIGLESSFVMFDVWKNRDWSCVEPSKLLKQFREDLVSTYGELLKQLSSLCEHAAGVSGGKFHGIDASWNPQAVFEAKETIGWVYEQLLSMIGKCSKSFGDSGSMTVSYLLTSAIQQAAALGKVKLCGYSGLMLPLMEDQGLAKAASDNRCGIQTLLLNSAVCGVGIDTVPISATGTTEESLALLILDVVSLASKWSKPLSCRVLPYDLDVGSVTDTDNKFLCNSKVLNVP